MRSNCILTKVLCLNGYGCICWVLVALLLFVVLTFVPSSLKNSGHLRVFHERFRFSVTYCVCVDTSDKSMDILRRLNSRLQ